MTEKKDLTKIKIYGIKGVEENIVESSPLVIKKRKEVKRYEKERVYFD